MAESLQKRLREGNEEKEGKWQKRLREDNEKKEGKGEGEGEAEIKRHCSFHHILSILESDEDEPTQDLSFLITTLQQELSSPHPVPTDPPPSSDEEEEVVMKHLLEASDDDLGIPHAEIEDGMEGTGERVEFSTYDEIWKLEDEDSGYRTFLQSELFISSQDKDKFM